MAKARVTGTVVVAPITGIVGENTKFSKFLVSVKVGGHTNNNPRVASNQATDERVSYFGVMAFGKQAEIAVQKGQVVEIDGRLEIADFQMDTASVTKKAAIITAEHITILQGNIQNYAKAYNVLANLVEQDAEIYNATNMNIFSQRIAINKKVGETDYPSFYRVKFFGDRGQKLFDKQLLNKSKVKSILVDGSISATYTKKETESGIKEYFNCEINVGDFQVASWASNDQSQQQSSGGNYGTYQPQGGTANAYGNTPYEQTTEIPEIDIDEEEIPF